MSSKQDLKEQISASMTAQQSQKSQPSKDKRLHRAIRKLKADSITDEATRFMAVQWLVMYHTMSAVSSENQKQVEVSWKNSKADMPLAQDLLNTEFSPQFKPPVLFLRADVCQRMGDYIKLNTVFHQILNLPSDIPQAQFIAMSLAPPLADWQRFVEIGKKMQGDIDRNLEQMRKLPNFKDESFNVPSLADILHQVSESGMPDYGVIWDHLKNTDLTNYKLPQPNDLFDEIIEFKNIDVKIDSIEASSDSKKEEIREQFNDDSELNLDNVSMSINGGIVSIPGLSSEVPVMLIGAYLNDEKILVEGYIDLQIQANDIENSQNAADMGVGGGQMPPSEITPEMIEAMQQLNPELFQMMQQQALGAAGNDDQNSLLSGNGANPFAAALQGAPANSSIPNGMAQAPQMNPMAMSNGAMGMPNEMMSPEYLAKMGIVRVRQHEKMELEKSDEGYVGTYSVRNYNPMLTESSKNNFNDQSQSKDLSNKVKEIDSKSKNSKQVVEKCKDDTNKLSDFDEESAINFKVIIRCEHPQKPVERISTGIDNLELD